MVLFSEQERLANNELNLLNDPTDYSANDATWTLLNDYGSFTLANPGIVLIKFDALLEGGGEGALRVKVGANHVFLGKPAYGTPTTYGTALYLPAGTYNVQVEDISTFYTIHVSNFQVGLAFLNDVQASALQTYTSGITLTVPTRPTPIGPLTNTTFFVHVYAYTPSANTAFENVGETLVNGVAVWVDGIQHDWSERVNDDHTWQAACAKLAAGFTAGSAHTVAITKANANTIVLLCVIASPWILPDDVFAPVTMNFPQNSTLYVVLEPWFTNPTGKLVGVGNVRAITFGLTDDYYSSSTGADIISYSSRIDIQDIANNNLWMKGLGGCIGIIGVDRP
jgi:hypothetical protein